MRDAQNSVDSSTLDTPIDLTSDGPEKAAPPQSRPRISGGFTAVNQPQSPAGVREASRRTRTADKAKARRVSQNVRNGVVVVDE